MTDAVTLGLIAGAAPVIGVVVLWLKVKLKLGEIHTLVNSKHDEALAKIESQMLEIRALRKVIGKTKVSHK